MVTAEKHSSFQNRRLTTEALLLMQDVKVWVVSLDKNRKPDVSEDVVKYVGLHTIERDRINDENTPLGFWAHLEPSKK